MGKGYQEPEDQGNKKMEKRGCVDGKLDDSNYSSPVPVIGLYITAATLVCLLFILLDVFAASRNRKRWLPCRLFSLNSVTLTLLSVAAKLPLDLTTAMPSVEDQLSKLTGTALTCICMGFFMPSLGSSRDSECFTNMAAMSILVISIVVNVCIQMQTGVIVLFRTQHVTILCCMMMLLMTLWYCAFDIHSQNEASIDGIKDNFTKGQKSMLYRLKMCYLYGYISNPQFVLCRNLINTLVGTLCMICSGVLLKVSFQSLVSKEIEFCEGVSIYKWSMKAIVVSQIITILVGSLAVTFRLLTLIGHQNYTLCILQKQVKDAESTILLSPVLKSNFLDSLVALVKILMRFLVNLIVCLSSLPYVCLLGCYQGCVSDIGCIDCWRPKYDYDQDVQEFKTLIHIEEMELDEWTLKKGAEDMRKCIQLTKTKTSNQLKQLLSKTPPKSQEHSPLSLLKAKYDLVRPGYKISSLSVVLLVRIATISIPSLSESLLSSLSEVFEFVHFVDRKMSSSSFMNKNKWKLAKALWASDKFNSLLLPKIVKKSGSSDEAFRSQSQLDQAIGIIKGLKGVLHSDIVIRDEAGMITDFIIRRRPYRSVEELYGYMEQIYVDMVNEFLIQLPNAIFKDIIESHAEDYEERVKFALKVVRRIEQLEVGAILQWSFPVGTTITHLIPNEASVLIGESYNMPLESNTNASTPAVLAPTRSSGLSVSTTTQDLAIQVE